MSLFSMFPGLGLNDINIIPYEARFTSNIAGSVNAGAITWDQITSQAHEALSSSMYYIHTLSYNMNLDQDILLNALDKDFKNGFLELDIISRDDQEIMNKSKIKFANYVNDRPLGLSYQVRRSNNVNSKQPIDFKVSGQILQTNDVITHLSNIGADTLDLYVQCVIVGINNQRWIEKNFIQG